MFKRSWKAGRRAYWTRERMIEAGARFYREHGVAPTNEDHWMELTQFTARTPSGFSTEGSKRPYPSRAALKKYWREMRAYWEEVSRAHSDLKIVIPEAEKPWSTVEEWFAIESAGIIPRQEVAELMGRSELAIKRRLHEMGINTYNRWGWTLNRVERVLGISAATIKYYLDHGMLPYFQGNKCVYIEPADLFVIKEYNWAKKRHPRELEEAVRKSLIQRLCYALLRFEWRKYSYHKAAPARKFYTGRIKRPRERKKPGEPRPKHIRVGDWCVVTGEAAKYFDPKRKGQIKSIVWSPQARAATETSPSRPPCWVVTIELKRDGEKKRTRINVSASCVRKTDAPPAPQKTLKPQRPRISRKMRLKACGQLALSNHLSVPVDVHKGENRA